jgi:hypothetical protein
MASATRGRIPEMGKNPDPSALRGGPGILGNGVQTRAPWSTLGAY